MSIRDDSDSYELSTGHLVIVLSTRKSRRPGKAGPRFPGLVGARRQTLESPVYDSGGSDARGGLCFPSLDLSNERDRAAIREGLSHEGRL